MRYQERAAANASGRRRFAAAIACAALGAALASCGQPLAAAAVQPGAGATARRIVSVVPAVTEMLFAIGAGPQVVAVSSYDNWPPEVKPLTRVGALLDPDVERILQLRPDLVVVYGKQSEL